MPRIRFTEPTDIQSMASKVTKPVAPATMLILLTLDTDVKSASPASTTTNSTTVFELPTMESPEENVDLDVSASASPSTIPLTVSIDVALPMAIVSMLVDSTRVNETGANRADTVVLEVLAALLE